MATPAIVEPRAAARPALVTWWRRSMQVRVLSTALAIGVATVALLGSFLSAAIRDGLFNQRVAQLDYEFARTVTVVREAFAASPATSASEVQALMLTMVRERIGAGQSIAVGSLLAAVDQNATGQAVNDVGSLVGLEDLVSPELRAATAEHDGQPMWQSVEIPARLAETGAPEPGIVFGSLVEVPTYGQFGLYVLYSLEAEQQTLSFVQTTLLAGGLAILATIGVITYLTTRQTVAPVQRAAATAARLADGNLDERMPVRGEDELATLGRSFNDMAQSLQMQIDQLERLSDSQRQFVSDVSHELRTPLTTIRMAGDVIYGSREDLDPAAQRSAELLQAQLDRFESLLADLLEISRHDAGAAALDVEDGDLGALTELVVTESQTLAEMKGVPIRIHLPAEPVRADFDSRRVERILRNLITNGIEHAEGLPMDITLGINDVAVAVVVRDYGVGLNADEVGRVFDRFWRADPARARTTGGTGLGLSISLEDAHLHNGKLEVAGEPGKGAAFRLTLPREHAHGSAVLDDLPSPVPLWREVPKPSSPERTSMTVWAEPAPMTLAKVGP